MTGLIRLSYIALASGALMGLVIATGIRLVLH